MDKNIKYLGHQFQISGVQKYQLVEGKGAGMRFLHVKNGCGLELHLSIDRALDIGHLSIDGINMSYITANGYVAPSYFDDQSVGFLKSFSGGFLTTCGLTQVGAPNVFKGVPQPLHGTISHIPSQNINVIESDAFIKVSGTIYDETIFSHKLILTRTYIISRLSNSFTIEDTIINRGDCSTPLQVLYHMNIGYPMLSEDAELTVAGSKVIARDEYASKFLTDWPTIQAPTAQYKEQCFYHTFNQTPLVTVTNKSIGKMIRFSFDEKQLPYLTVWKMFGIRDYVLGIEPGNCFPDGCQVAAEQGILQHIQPDEQVSFKVTIDFLSSNKE